MQHLAGDAGLNLHRIWPGNSMKKQTWELENLRHGWRNMERTWVQNGFAEQSSRHMTQHKGFGEAAITSTSAFHNKISRFETANSEDI